MTLLPVGTVGYDLRSIQTQIDHHSLDLRMKLGRVHSMLTNDNGPAHQTGERARWQGALGDQRAPSKPE
ncbi:MAG: hypothetical protein H6830_08630 [Planctomycetes bacterium]|nr:hypothetical protein [Planctomycetota bacterium]MCB9909660.1 hypothetical protein [Planctomycetota bacterium]MCB9911851.1 hypothetical protein [Planctomycetota bacterium]HPF14829.1 hypothetical protein [Planctomycetota bacterium]HRV80426.1 hypothetical protein [Planctomycetota bacterium]